MLKVSIKICWDNAEIWQNSTGKIMQMQNYKKESHEQRFPF